MSYCLKASCLAHRERIFWQPPEHAWVHTNCYPCEALAGESDPTELLCRYCGLRVEVSPDGSLWSLAGRGLGHWEKQPNGTLWWVDDGWVRGCEISPTFVHEVQHGILTQVKH